MFIEVAQFLTILATGLFFLCFVFSVIFNVNDLNIINLISRIYSHSFLLFLFSFLIYVWLAITDNFSVLYIAQHSNTNLPVFYKISSIWSAHEGSMYLWIIFLSLWGAIYNFFSKNDEPLKARTIGIISLTTVGFLLFLLLTYIFNDRCICTFSTLSFLNNTSIIKNFNIHNFITLRAS